MRLATTLFITTAIVCGNTVSAETIGTICFNSPASYQVLGMSENGKWACGVNYIEDTNTTYGFRWNLETGKIEMTGDNNYGIQIANDGTMVGSYFTNTVGNGVNRVEAAAIWQDGHWTALEYPTGCDGCWGYAISPDGHYVTGTGNNYVSYVWKDGQLTNTLQAWGSSITYSIAPNGQYAGGWVSPQGTRCAGYWTTADNQFHYMEPEVWDEEDQMWEHIGSPWQSVKKFSSDSQKFLYWGGYHIDPRHPERGYGIKAIYDFATQDTTYIYPSEEDPFNFDFFDMNGDGSMVVGYQQDFEGAEHAIIWRQETGQTEFLEQYLVSLGCSFDDYNMMELSNGSHYIARGLTLSADGKTMAVLYYDNQYEYHTLIVALDRNIAMTPAVNLEAHQVTGLPSVKLNWDAPLGDKSTLQGYNIYRNEALIATIPSGDPHPIYYDRDLEKGEYAYTVVATYAEGNAEPTDAVSVTIAERQLAAPQSLFARQKGYNDAYVMWNTPASNLTPCSYIEESRENEVDGFGGGSVSFESGTCFPAEQMSLYAGYRLTAVSFYPKSEQGSWLVNVYTHGTTGELTQLGSFKVDNASITLNEYNTFYLPRQISLMEGNDLVIGIQANINNPSYDVQGVYTSSCQIGYTDLIREVGDPDFYSMNAASQGAYNVTWCVSALLAPEGISKDIDAIDHYNVYVDDVMVGESLDTYYKVPALGNGNHDIAVEATYAEPLNGITTSAKVSTSLNIQADLKALKPITPAIKASNGVANIRWNAPTDDDATVLGYANDVPGEHAPRTTDDVSEVLALAEFPAQNLRGYEDYEIRSVSFYPLADVGFAIMVYSDDEMVANIEVEDVVAGRWNTILLDEAVSIESGSTYRLIIDCYDSPAGVAPLATDNQQGNDNGNLYQVPGDEGWYSITEFGSSGNWMMLLNIADPYADTFEIDSYAVYVDGALMANQAEQTFAYTLADDQQHTVRVDAHYLLADHTVTGNEVTFDLNTSALSAITADTHVAAAVYTLDGLRHSAPVCGFNIIRTQDGVAHKQLCR